MARAGVYLHDKITGDPILINALSIAYILPNGTGSDVYFAGMRNTQTQKLEVRESVAQIGNLYSLPPPTAW